VIRRATPEDARALGALQLRAWWHAYACYVDHDRLAEHTVESRAARWTEILAGDVATFVADVGGRVTGFVSVGAPRSADPEPGLGELYAIYVDPPAQGAGMGTTLLRRGEEELRRLGYDRAVLCVFVRNGLARAFYERHGWRAEDPPVVLEDRWSPELRYRRAL
jgi:ribosomal protein S18 acetylase RimI-like enzyme